MLLYTLTLMEPILLRKTFQDVFPHYLNRWKKKSISFDTIPTSYKYIILNPLKAKCFNALGIITFACGFPFILNSITSLKAESGS